MWFSAQLENRRMDLDLTDAEEGFFKRSQQSSSRTDWSDVAKDFFGSLFKSDDEGKISGSQGMDWTDDAEDFFGSLFERDWTDDVEDFFGITFKSDDDLLEEMLTYKLLTLHLEGEKCFICCDRFFPGQGVAILKPCGHIVHLGYDTWQVLVETDHHQPALTTSSLTIF